MSRFLLFSWQKGLCIPTNDGKLKPITYLLCLGTMVGCNEKDYEKDMFPQPGQWRKKINENLLSHLLVVFPFKELCIYKPPLLLSLCLINNRAKSKLFSFQIQHIKRIWFNLFMLLTLTFSA